MRKPRPIEIRIAGLLDAGHRPTFYGYMMRVPRSAALHGAVPLSAADARTVDEYVRTGPLTLLEDNKDAVVLGPTAWYHLDGKVYELSSSDLLTRQQRDAIEATVRRQSRMWR